MDKIDKIILIDGEIPHAKKLFSGFNQIKFFDPVKGLDPVKNLDEVEALIIRSTLEINRSVLARLPRLEFIGTTTAGQDHIVEGKNKVQVISAPGCNAEAVCDYVFYALFSLDGFVQHWFQNLKFGIVGVGNVGTRVWNRAKRFGFQTVLVDPPREKRATKFRGAPFEDLYDCDIVSLHVPLTTQGKYPTAQMINEEFFEKIKPQTIFINTSRGDVVDETLLIKYRQKLGGLILDVYQNEPFPRTDLIDRADVTTPHIAGHSHQAFYRGGLMVARKCYQYFQRPDLASQLDKVETLYQKQERQIPKQNVKPMDNFVSVLKSVFDIRAATKLTKQQALSFTTEKFAQLRSQLRREENRFISLCSAPSKKYQLPPLLTHMGFTLKNQQKKKS